jgi:hypothetical protein
MQKRIGSPFAPSAFACRLHESNFLAGAQRSRIYQRRAGQENGTDGDFGTPRRRRKGLLHRLATCIPFLPSAGATRRSSCFCPNFPGASLGSGLVCLSRSANESRSQTSPALMNSQNTRFDVGAGSDALMGEHLATESALKRKGGGA